MKRPTKSRPVGWLRSFLLLTILITASVLGVQMPAQASATVLLSGSSWLDGQGVNVCAPSTDPVCGDQARVGGWEGNWWQCVELAQRLYQARGWHGGIFANVSYAYQIYDQASALGMSRQANGSITSLVPGDMIIHDTDTPYSYGAGHVSIVDSVVGSTVNVVEQNTFNNDPTGQYTLSAGTLSRAGTGTIRGVVHDPDNQSASSVDAQFYSPNLVKNGSFGGGTSGWSIASGGNFAVYQGSGAQSGAKYAATNGGGIYQDIAVDVDLNQAFCATAEVRTSGGGTGSEGIMKVWLLGGSYNDGEQVNFGPLGSTWKQVKVCSVATAEHTTVRIQFYPTAGPTLNIDSVDVHRSLAKNASFGGATSGWTATAGANFVTYLSGQQGSGADYTSQSGIRYAATNSGGFYQDVPNLDIKVNDAFCATAEVRTSNGGSGATGKLKIWLLGGSYNDGEDVSFGSLGDTWEQVKVCGVATTAHTTLRIQFYTTSSHTLDVDDVDVHQSLADNASFGGGTAGWTTSSGSNFVTYLSGQQGSGTNYLSQSGIRYAATNGGGFYQDAALTIGVNRTFCATAEVRTSNGGTGAAGIMKVWQLGDSSNDGESVSFGPLGSDWTQIKSCGVATGSHTYIRIQFYTTTSATLDVDDVDIH